MNILKKIKKTLQKRNVTTDLSSSEKRMISLLKKTRLFDPTFYLNNNPDVKQAGADPSKHYIKFGIKEGRFPSVFFDPAFYASQFPEGEKPENPLLHYLESSWNEARNPCKYFDQKWYIERNKITPGQFLTPVDHYLEQSYPFRCDPSPIFSNSQYLLNHQDVADAGINPLQHYLQSGKKEGRKIFGQPRYRINATAPLPRDCDALIFVAFCPDGSLSDLQCEMMKFYKDEGFFLITMVNTGDFNHYNSYEKETASDIMIVRENVGFDFGAWAEAVRVIGGLSQKCRSVSFTNDSIIPLRGRGKGVMAMIRRYPRGVVFMTKNNEIKPHEQSYFFTVNGDCLKKGALCVLERFSQFQIKEDVIHHGEIVLGDTFRQEAFDTHTVFDFFSDNNPTIHYWRKLLRKGFPFFKIQLVTAGIEKLSSPDVQKVLGEKTAALCEKHLKSRSTTAKPRTLEINALPVRAIPNCELIGPIGELQAYNYPPGQNLALQIPFEEDLKSDCDFSEFGKVLAVVHCFYVDVAERILHQLDTLGLPGMVLCTTDTEEKKIEIQKILSETSLYSEVTVTPNRGRDVAPFLIESARLFKGHDHILHLHTKKSPHCDSYADWGNYLFRNLIGSAAAVKSILKLLDSGKAGLIYSKHFHEVEGLRNWGFDYEKARNILKRLHIDISVDQILEFPTSTMFWARTDAIRPLFELALSYNDFDPEEGQIDGTLAHAIERSLLYICEKTGFDHYMVTTDRDSDADQILQIDRADYIDRLEIPKPRLLESFGKVSGIYNENYGIYPVQVKCSKNLRPRFNILIPTMEPEKIYGGISSALKIAMGVYEALDQGSDIRIIVTSDRISQSGLEETAKRMPSEVFMVGPHSDVTCPTITTLPFSRGIPLSLRAQDMFFATAWWTADLGYRLQASQERIFGTAAKVVYLIQDYEPGFYPWSFQSVMAKNTYDKGDKTLAIINSEELANFMKERYLFPECWHIPYEINRDIADAREVQPTENLILVYGRPNVSRNLFGTIVEGLRLWQAADPIEREKTEIVFAGEEFDQALLSELMNATVVGKLPLDDYANMLSRAAVGISLMESPHPSYPPLEMASSGCITIANGYDNKDMTLRSENIISLDELSPRGLKTALDRAFSRVTLDEEREFSDIRPIETTIPLMSYEDVAMALQKREKGTSIEDRFVSGLNHETWK